MITNRAPGHVSTARTDPRRAASWRRIVGAGLLLAGLAVVAGQTCTTAEERGVRAPAVAGSFYPAEPGRLSRALDGLFADARPPRGERPIAIVAPHAGYVYSGQVAADAFNQAHGQDYALVVIVGPNHTRAGFDRIGALPGTGLRTPLGIVPLDERVAAAVARSDPDVVADAGVHESEHSIEVQVPFVQRLWPHASLVAFITGTEDAQRLVRFGRALAQAVQGRRVLLVASSDLAHYPSSERARRIDARTLEAMAGLDPVRFADTARDLAPPGDATLVTAACGRGPIVAVMAAALALGATRATVASYANSGDVAVGDTERAVGYGAVVFSAGPSGRDTSVLRAAPSHRPQGPPSQAERTALLALARRSIERALASGVPPLPRDEAAGGGRTMGAFVTLTIDGQLRGCIGRIEPDRALGPLVSRMAVSAAFEDPRFQPVTADELDRIHIEISLLTAAQHVDSADRIVAGRDGVALQKDGARAVFLPQVATEQGWTRDELLDHLCEKAGLAASCWHQGASLSTFRADVFGEEH
jgi:hypothetical protein